MTAYITKLKDKTGNQQLPVTHERAVRDDNGTTLESKMQNLEGAMDKAYVASSDNGMGRITLKKKMVSGVNTLTQSMMTQTNTIYVIQYDFTLGENINVPANCVLEFDGGSISGAYTLTGNNTGIDANLVQVFGISIILGGTWNVVEAYPEWFYDGDKTAITDATDAFQKALTVSSKVFVNTGYYAITKPIVIPRQGCSIIGTGNALPVLSYVGGNAYPDRGVIEFVVGTPETDPQVWGSWGLTLQHLHITGNSAKIHGVKMRKIGYPLFYDVMIDGFNGAGLLLDKCQDGSFENCNIQRCGRFKDGQSDREDVNASEYAAVHLCSTVQDDACNMLRFNKCQIENNGVSPYVYIQSGIGLHFSQCHVENRTFEETFTFCCIEDGEGEFEDIDCSPKMKGVYVKGYSGILINGGRNFGDITYGGEAANKGGTLRCTGAALGNINVVAYSGEWKFTGCGIGNITMHYPASNMQMSNCSTGDIELAYPGIGYIQITDCYINGNFTKTHNLNYLLRNNTITGNLSADGGGGIIEGNSVGGTTSIGNLFDVAYYIPRNKTTYLPSIPIYSTWSVGDIVYNSNPTPGSYIGWICTTAGTGQAAVWKGFGLIES